MRRRRFNAIVVGSALIGCGNGGDVRFDAVSEADASSRADGEDGRDGGTACVTAGSLDPSFGVGGVTAPVLGLTPGQVVDAVAIKVDAASRIVVAGGFLAGPRSCVVARFLSDGNRDPSFGANGIVRHSVGPSVCWFNAVAIQPDGKLVATGAIDGHSNPRALVTRFLMDGTPDPTFGSGGDVIFETTPITTGMALAVDTIGRVVVAGERTEQSTMQFLIRRYTTNGGSDSSFGTAGNAEPAFANGRDVASDLEVQPDGRIIVVGAAASTSDPEQFGITRYNGDGTKDPSFGSTGLVSVPFGSHATATGIALDTQGRSVVAGWSDDAGALLRLTSDGELDVSFGDNGKVIDTGLTRFGYASVATTTDGKIVAVGSSSSSNSSSLVVARYSETGLRDSTFGSNGFGTQIPSPMRQIGWDAAIQPDGGILVVGGYGDLSSFDILVARYCP